MTGTGMILTPEQMHKLKYLCDVSVPLLATDWQGTAAPYTIQVDWPGMTDRDMPEIWLVPAGDAPTDAELAAARLITPSTENGHLLFSASAKPATSITARVTGVPISGEFTAANMASLVSKVDHINTGLLIKEAGIAKIASAPVNSNGYVDVAFVKHYDTTPVVMVTVQNASSTNVIASCYDITTIGCRIYIRNNHTSAMTNVVVGYAVVGAQLLIQ